MHCPLCNSLLESKVDEQFFHCSGCGAYVMDSAFYPDAKEEEQHYLLHENDVMNAGYRAFTAPMSDAILELYPSSASGLDYGCGTGPVISKVLEENGFRIQKYDPFFYPVKEYLKETYDFIFSCEVFEHFHQPAKEIASLVDILLPKGHLFIMTHLFEEQKPFSDWYYRTDPTHVFIYTPETMQYIAREYQLKIIQLSERMTIFQKGA